MIAALSKIQPYGDRFFVRAVRPDHKTEGGVYLPDTVDDSSNEGVVVAVGPQAAGDVALGDRVIFAALSGTDIEIGGEKYIVLTARNILAFRR